MYGYLERQLPSATNEWTDAFVTVRMHCYCHCRCRRYRYCNIGNQHRQYLQRNATLLATPRLNCPGFKSRRFPSIQTSSPCLCRRRFLYQSRVAAKYQFSSTHPNHPLSELPTVCNCANARKKFCCFFLSVCQVLFVCCLLACVDLSFFFCFVVVGWHLGCRPAQLRLECTTG